MKVGTFFVSSVNDRSALVSSMATSRYPRILITAALFPALVSIVAHSSSVLAQEDALGLLSVDLDEQSEDSGTIIYSAAFLHPLTPIPPATCLIVSLECLWAGAGAGVGAEEVLEGEAPSEVAGAAAPVV